MFKKISIANKTFLAFLALTVVVTGVVSTTTFWQARGSLAALAFDQLTSVREMKASQIEDYLQLIANQVVTFSADRMVIDTMRQLTDAYHGLTDELAYGEERIADIDAELVAFYETEFLPRLRRNLGAQPTVSDYMPTPLTARVLQHLYMSGNPHNVGSKDFLVDAGDGSEYSRVHAKVHPIYRNYLRKFGYYDIFLIDPISGEIVYSVFKEVDVGTSLIDGPHAKSGLGRVFRATRGSVSSETVEVVDFEPYHPSYNRPAAFVASPIFDDGRRIGVLAFQMPIDRINQIMTSDQNWSAVGLGESGESYIVADDYRLRNQSRFLIEDSENYFRMIEKTGTPQEVIDQIRNLDSTIGLQEVRTVGTEAALAGETDTRLFDDYRGVPVLSSYRPLDVEGLNWVIMSEIDAAEAFKPIAELARQLAIIGALSLIAVFIAAIVFSRTLTRPLAQLRQNSAALADGDLDVQIDTMRRDEIGDLARNFDQMREALRELIEGLEAKVEERTEKLRDSEERVSSILRNAADGIIVIDGIGTVQLFNRSAETLFAYSAEEVIGENVKMLMPERLAVDHDSHLKRYHATGEKRILGATREVVGQRKDGSEFPMELHVGEARLGEDKTFVGIVRDIAERKHFEKKIADNLSFVTTLVDSVPNPIFVKDTSGRYVNFNRAYEQAFNIRREDIIGKSVRELEFFPEEYRNARHEEDVRLLRDGGSTHREMSVELGDGVEHDMLFWARAFDLSDGSRGGILGVFVDISQQKELERRLSIANKRMGDELNIGRQIQMSMIPLTFPRFPEHKDLDVWAYIRPAREVGGDFYDFFMIDDRYFAFVIADVSGKGVPAALMMAVAKTLLKSRSQDTKSTSNIIAAANNELSENNDDCMFITAFFGIIDTKTGIVTYTNAGHNPPYLIKTDGTVETLSELHGPMVGVMSGMPYGETQKTLDVDDKIILYTDGVTEAFDANGNDYGEARLESFIGRCTTLGTKYLVESLVRDVDGFVDGEEQSDDITVFCLRYVAWDVRDARGTVELRLVNKLVEINRCLTALEEIVERFEIPPEIQNSFSVVLDDLLNNIINYAYDDDDEHIIDVVLSTDGQRFIVSVTDGGVEFDPFARKEPDVQSGIEEREIGGLGIHLIRNLMDDYSYRRVEGMNITTLMKRFAGEMPRQQDETTKN